MYYNILFVRVFRYSFLLMLLMVFSIGNAQMTEVTDSSCCKLYLCLNHLAANDDPFHLYLNEYPACDIKNLTRMMFKIYSEGTVTIRDNDHKKPIVTFTAKHGQNIYVRIHKKGLAKYFTLWQAKTEYDINIYLTQYFYAKYGSYSSLYSDQGTYIEMEEPRDFPIEKRGE